LHRFVLLSASVLRYTEIFRKEVIFMDGYGLSLAKKRERAYAEIERQKKEAEAAEREARREQREIESNDAAKRSADASERSARSADRANVISVIALLFALASLVISVLK
jgi:hypothetical protein